MQVSAMKNRMIDTKMDLSRFLSLTEKGSTSGVLSRLGREIVSGHFEPGSRLPDEANMLDRYSVSRTALREAYSKLTAKGMLTARPKVGTSVTKTSDWNMLDPEVLSWHLQTMPAVDLVHDLYALRRMIEPGAAALAAANRTDSDVEEIRAAFRQMNADSKYEDKLVEADLRFHVAILQATHNHFIGAFSSLIHAAMLSTFTISWRGADAAVIKEVRLKQHEDVLSAIVQGAGERANDCMKALLDDSFGDVAEALNE